MNVRLKSIDSLNESTDDLQKVVRAWNAEYAGGRYNHQPPIAFVNDILEAARSLHLIGARGLYVGCGNGRNYVPLVAGGLDLVGIDISEVAIEQLAARLPDRRDRLIIGSLDSLPARARYPIVIGIQVFQHGDERRAQKLIFEAQTQLQPGGLFCIRVNADSTDLEFDHEIIERSPKGGYTVRYLAGPKAGLDIHFFARDELADLFQAYEALLPLRLSTTWRKPARCGQWSQWEAIWRKPHRAGIDRHMGRSCG